MASSTTTPMIRGAGLPRPPELVGLLLAAEVPPLGSAEGEAEDGAEGSNACAPPFGEGFAACGGPPCCGAPC